MKVKPRVLIAIAILISFVIVISLVYAYIWFDIMSESCCELYGEQVEVKIEKGMTLPDIANILEEKQVILNREKFKWAARLTRSAHRFQPGLHVIERGLTYKELVEKLTQPGEVTKNVTIPEGLTYKQIAGLLQDELAIDSAEFSALCADSQFIGELGVDAGSLEGYLYPNTYNFYLNSNSRQAIKRIVDHFFNLIDNEILEKASQSGLSLHEALTLASIIQGEVMVWDEARLISSVYHNRLKRRIPLAADPTIQYIIPDGPRRLLNKDLEIKNPYNTYKYAGLPPGPINNPGVKAIKAAADPADTDYIYFVAKGDGTHYFNSTLQGHVRDKAKFQQVRRKVAREKRKRGNE